MQAKFVTSAANAAGFLRPDKPVIAVSGRSNVGKSSFINMVAGQNRLARTSSEPGRTRLVNYFDFGDFLLADLPGYGYARVPQAEKAKWAKLLDDFFLKDRYCDHVFALADIRHPPSTDDITMVNLLYETRTPFTLVATKADKLGKTRVVPAVRELAASFRTGEGNIVAVSAVTGRGREEIFARIRAVTEMFRDAAEPENPEA